MSQETDAVAEVLKQYPRIYLACHTRHVQDPETGEELSAHQASILNHLDVTDPTGLVELARHMGVTPSTMSLAVDRLVSSGCVSRERGATDARRVSLRLTEKGARIKRETSVLDPKLVSVMLSHLSKEELPEALRGLELLGRASMELMHSRSSKDLVKRRQNLEKDGKEDRDR